MNAIIAGLSEQNLPPQKTQPETEQQAPPERLVNKFDDARRAKKKEKRARHRSKLRRSHTNG